MNESAMSHNYSVFIITLIIYSTLKWSDSINIKRTFLIGLLCGLAVLVRPINGLVVLFPILYFMVKSGGVKQSFDLLLEPKVLFPAFLGGFLGILPQLIYWKAATGDWIYYSYKEEGFFLSDPQFLKGLFSFRKGWLIYTPLMILGLIGLIPLYKKHKALAIPTIVILPIYMYVIFMVVWRLFWNAGND
jgi:4-amino-4-deoxy-L-arabinose transferase-like glycosyltransferase